MLERARELLWRHFGARSFRPGQAEAIGAALDGRDALVVMPTGAGKSACYQLPALLLPGVTLVISPLIALQKDQVDRLRARGLAATCVNSSLAPPEIDARLAQVAAGRIRLLYVAPERFDNARFGDWLRTVRVSLVAVDEAHCVSEWGHDFRPSYFRLKAVRERLDPVPMMAVTATATPEVRRDIRMRLGLRDPVIVIRGFDRPNLRWHVIREERTLAKNRRLVRLFRAAPPGGSSLVYASTRKAVTAVTTLLRAHGVPAAAYHAGLPPARRRAVQDAFARGDLPVVVATNAFGLGIDLASIRRVVHYTMPGSLEAYYQEAGRAGRDGEPADCILLHAYRDRFVHEGFIQAAHPPKDVVREVWLALQARADPSGVVAGAVAAWGRRCRSSLRHVYAAIHVLDQAGAVQRLRGRASCYVRAVWRPGAAEAARVLEPQVARVWDALRETAGEHLARGAVVPKSWLSRWAGGVERGRWALDRLREAGALDWYDLEREGGVRLSEPSLEFERLAIPWEGLAARCEFEREKLRRMERYAYHTACRRAYVLRYFGERPRGPCTGCDVCLRLHPLHARDAPRSAAGAAAVRALRDWRRRLAETWGLPAYFVIEDAALVEIARRRPLTVEALADVPGVPPEIVRRAGAALLRALNGTARAR